jgi:hypothetical protein
MIKLPFWYNRAVPPLTNLVKNLNSRNAFAGMFISDLGQIGTWE